MVGFPRNAIIAASVSLTRPGPDVPPRPHAVDAGATATEPVRSGSLQLTRDLGALSSEYFH